MLDLPVLFVCENNGYGEYTPMEVVTGGGSIIARAEALGVPQPRSTGWTVAAVRELAVEVDRARPQRGGAGVRRGARPIASSATRAAIPGQYRPEGELDRWRERDPLIVAAAQLRDDYGLGGRGRTRSPHEVEAELDSIEASALAAPFPEPRDRTPSSTTRRVLR